MSQRIMRPRRWMDGFILGCLTGIVFASVAGILFSVHSKSGPADFLSLPELRAELGEGHYLYLPNRRNMWVANRRNGRLIHYKIIDPEKGRVEKSQVGQINQAIFPPEQTEYIISERNITDLLWVCNRQTGDFQLWRRNTRDGSLVTDQRVITAARPLMGPAYTPAIGNVPEDQ